MAGWRPDGTLEEAVGRIGGKHIGTREQGAERASNSIACGLPLGGHGREPKRRRMNRAPGDV
jgi:hypothetical protein